MVRVRKGSLASVEGSASLRLCGYFLALSRATHLVTVEACNMAPPPPSPRPPPPVVQQPPRAPPVNNTPLSQIALQSAVTAFVIFFILVFACIFWRTRRQQHRDARLDSDATSQPSQSPCASSRSSARGSVQGTSSRTSPSKRSPRAAQSKQHKRGGKRSQRAPTQDVELNECSSRPHPCTAAYDHAAPHDQHFCPSSSDTAGQGAWYDHGNVEELSEGIASALAAGVPDAELATARQQLSEALRGHPDPESVAFRHMARIAEAKKAVVALQKKERTLAAVADMRRTLSEMPQFQPQRRPKAHATVRPSHSKVKALAQAQEERGRIAEAKQQAQRELSAAAAAEALFIGLQALPPQQTLEPTSAQLSNNSPGKAPLKAKGEAQYNSRLSRARAANRGRSSRLSEFTEPADAERPPLPVPSITEKANPFLEWQVMTAQPTLFGDDVNLEPMVGANSCDSSAGPLGKDAMDHHAGHADESLHTTEPTEYVWGHPDVFSLPMTQQSKSEGNAGGLAEGFRPDTLQEPIGASADANYVEVANDDDVRLDVDNLPDPNEAGDLTEITATSGPQYRMNYRNAGHNPFMLSADDDDDDVVI